MTITQSCEIGTISIPQKNKLKFNKTKQLALVTQLGSDRIGFSNCKAPEY